MESLAVLVVLIVFGIIALGVVSFVVVLRPARRGWTRVVLLPFAILAVIGGGWLALLDLVVIGGGTLLVIGAAVALAGLVALVRSLRARRPAA